MYIFHTGTYNSDLQKMVYLENRQYLSSDDSLRREAVGFPNNSEDDNPPPAKRIFCDIKKDHRAHDNSLCRYKPICYHSYVAN